MSRVANEVAEKVTKHLRNRVDKWTAGPVCFKVLPAGRMLLCWLKDKPHNLRQCCGRHGIVEAGDVLDVLCEHPPWVQTKDAVEWTMGEAA